MVPTKGSNTVFSVTQDAFSSGNPELVNHKKYYYMAVAYGYNNFIQFDPTAHDSLPESDGQLFPYIESSRNIQQYTGIPRPVNDVSLNAVFGEGLQVTRLEGKGTGRNFLDFSEEYEDQILAGTFDGVIPYYSGFSPIDIQIFNPIDVVDGNYLLGFLDEDMDDNELGENAYWFFLDEANPEDTIFSYRPINESGQLLKDYGLAVTFDNFEEPGFDADNNGVIGATIEFEDPKFPWLSFVQQNQIFLPGTGFSISTDYLKTNSQQPDEKFDPEQDFETMLNGMFVPFKLCDYRTPTTTELINSPAWVSSDFKQVRNNDDLLGDLNNVNIVLTSDREKWSRCIVVESTNSVWKNSLGYNVADDRDQFQLSTNPSVGKEVENGKPKPDNDETIGMSWFPGYAYDVETGKRLNIFFGEASIYDTLLNSDVKLQYSNGNDMIFNPGSELLTGPISLSDPKLTNFHLGGQHMIYVTNQEYDGCDTLSYMLNPG